MLFVTVFNDIFANLQEKIIVLDNFTATCIEINWGLLFSCKPYIHNVKMEKAQICMHIYLPWRVYIFIVLYIYFLFYQV